ncbi:MAG: cytochrome c [Polyangiaceae bacterium]
MERASLRRLLSFRSLISLALAGSLAAASACGDRSSGTSTGAGPSTEAPSASASAATSASASAASTSTDPDPKRGAELVVKFECARCHDGLKRASPIPLPASTAEPVFNIGKPDNQHCFHCHAEILAGRYSGPSPSVTERWKANVEHLREVPSLTGTHQRFRRAWIESFLAKPHDLRPRLAPTMPRLALSPAQIRDIAAFLVPEEKPAADPPAPSKEVVREGRAIFENKGCPACHTMSGTGPLRGGTAPTKGERNLTPAMRLAPDLRHTRDRMAFATIKTWVQKPQSIKSDTLMPETPMSDDDAEKIASFLIGEPLSPEELPKMPTRLPVLERHVSYQELRDRLFNKICWHCHSDEDYAIGDGGPGNTGGFGFTPRGLNLAAYDGILSGSIDDEGERRSIFTPMPDGTPRLVAALVARWLEEAGKEDPAIRGMPLGMPALSAEDVQLVETWIAQGHSPD